MIKNKIAINTTVFIHALITIYFFASALLVFMPPFYKTHFFLHVSWTILLVFVFILLKKYNGCPLTFLEKYYLEDDNKKVYGKSFVVHWTYKLTGIKLPIRAVNFVIYIYLFLALASWINV